MPALFLAGGGGNPASYSRLLRQLRELKPVNPEFERLRSPMPSDEELEERGRRVHLLALKNEPLIIIGHSIGAMLALALAGGVARNRRGDRLALHPLPQPIEALVLMMPATAFYAAPDSLAAVNVPTLIISAQKDDITPPWQAQLVVDHLPKGAEVVHHLEPDAGHFACMDPFPPGHAQRGMGPWNDPPGFDREPFLERLGWKILEFARAHE